MKHSDLKVGMKVKRVSYFSEDFYAATQGNISTVESIDNNNSIFYVEEEKGCYFEAQYFEPIEETKEKETINTESKLISMDKNYKTRCGNPVRVLCVDRNDPEYPVVALVTYKDGEGLISFSSKGIFSDESIKHDFDLIEVSPYEDFKKDDKVMVSHDGTIWYKRYFSHVTEAGLPHCFADGKSSWNSEYAGGWNYCRKPTQEELGE